MLGQTAKEKRRGKAGPENRTGLEDANGWRLGRCICQVIGAKGLRRGAHPFDANDLVMNHASFLCGGAPAPQKVGPVATLPHSCADAL